MSSPWGCGSLLSQSVSPVAVPAGSGRSPAVPVGAMQGLPRRRRATDGGPGGVRPQASQLAPVLPYLLMVGVLALRPRGLLGRREG